MNLYRITIRYGRPQRYHVEDVTAASLMEAMRLAAERVMEPLDETADLVEIRRQVDPDLRR